MKFEKKEVIMTGKKIGVVFTALVFLGAFTFLAWAEGDEKDEKGEFNVKIAPGVHYTDYSSSAGKVGEYEFLENGGAGAHADFSATGRDKDVYLDLHGSYYEDNDYMYDLEADLRRIIMEDFSYSRFEHRLDHDPLENLSAHAGGPKVSHKDWQVGKDYMIQRSELKSDTTLNLPFLPGGQVHFNYRREAREGQRQALAISHCGGCHVVNNGREVNEETQDYKMGASMKFGGMSLAYSYFHRDFQENGATPTNAYDDAIHPVTSADFSPRVQYDDATLAYNLVPDSQKDSHLVKVMAKLPQNTTFFGSYVHSKVENGNNYPDVPTNDSREMDSDTITARLTNNSLFPGLNLGLKFRYLSLDNDDVNVDVNHTTWPAGVDPDFIRKSAMSRDETTIGLDSSYRLTKKTSLKFGYKWEQIDRDNYEVGVGETKTEKNTVKLGVSSRLHRKLKAKIGYKWQDIDNPFNNLKAACEPANATFPVYYSDRQETRTATLSNQPTDVNEITADLIWSVKPNLSLTANYRWLDKENDDVSDWQQESHMPSINLWYAPTAKLSFNLSYVYDWTKTETLACVPVFDG
jgi:hypothetical protein